MKSYLPWQLYAPLRLAATVAALVLAPGGTQAQVNTAYGNSVLSHDTNGTDNSAFGYFAMYFNTAGTGNTAMGYTSLFYNNVGEGNTAIGDSSLYFNTTGEYNVATGFNALLHNNADFNTATGYEALTSNTTGGANTADGAGALLNNATGYDNTASGFNALFYTTTGSENCAVGMDALFSNGAGNYNTASGNEALYANSSGEGNVADGIQALYLNTTGAGNTASGLSSLYSNTTGNYNVGIGRFAGANLTTGSNNIDIGNPGVGGESGVTRIGIEGTSTAAYIAGINGAYGGAGVTVFVNSKGQLYTKKSSRRFKMDIHSMGSISDRLMRLRPVTFRYKQAAPDGTHPLEYGLIAEEVAKVFPNLVQYDKQGKPLAIYYDALTPMLLNEAQKEHRQIAALSAARSHDAARFDASLKAVERANRTQRMEIAALRQSQQQQATELAQLLAMSPSHGQRGRRLVARR